MDRNSDTGTSVGFTVGELIDALGFMEPGKSLVVVGTVEIHVFFDFGTEMFADVDEDLFVSFFSHDSVREVSMHSRSVPVTFDWFWMPFNSDVVLLADSL